MRWLSWTWLDRIRSAFAPIEQPSPTLAATQRGVILRDGESLDEKVARSLGPKGLRAMRRAHA